MRKYDAIGQPPDEIADYLRGFRLLDGERVESIEAFERRAFNSDPSSLEQIVRLTNSPNADSIGEGGPSLASLSLGDLAVAATPDHLKLYEVLFGRDSLRVAIDLISSYPELARTTVVALAELQGVTHNHEREEEPGRIVHEVRTKDDPIAQELTARLGWDWPYYGSVDATPEFVRTLTAYIKKTEDNSELLSQKYIDRTGNERDIAYALDFAIEWILARMDANTEGFVEFKSELEKGIENQVWKDSWDAYHHSDGTLANHNRGIASVEVQVTAYDALLDAAYIDRHILDRGRRANELEARAATLKEMILKTFWTDDDGGYFVLGTDRDDKGNLRQLKVKTSNMGHVINSRLLEGDDPRLKDMLQRTIAHILSPKMLNASGIRTLASDEVRFRPGAYHNGSVWLWDTHHIAKGLRRHGYHEASDDLDRRLLRVVNETNIFPEYVRGDESGAPTINPYRVILWDSINNRFNTVEQPPQEVQAWTVAAILAIKKRLDRKQRAIDLRKLHILGQSD